MAKKQAKRTSRKKNVPKNEQQAAAMVEQMGEINRQMAALEAELNSRIAPYQAAIEQARLGVGERMQELEDKIRELYRGVREWSEQNRDSLLSGGGKTFQLVSGRCSWVLCPPSVRTSKGHTIDDAIGELSRRRANYYLRVRMEVDKDAILADRNNFEKRAFKTLAIVQPEEFVVRPNNAPVELSAVKGAKIKIRDRKEAEK